MFELSKQFRFDAAHTLQRTIDNESSARIHGHSYRAEVTVRGLPDSKSGMLLDLGLFEQVLREARDGLDHQFLDQISDLGPATLENLCAWIWRRLAPRIPKLVRIAVYRDSSGDMCTYYGPDGQRS
jgi:6-pyruvoyltetrahydropterin/6-carboxytetrahydropterin synthase